jgi:hypothetical protein
MLDTVGCLAGIKSVLHKRKVLDGKIKTMLVMYNPSANYLIIMNHIFNLYAEIYFILRKIIMNGNGVYIK